MHSDLRNSSRTSLEQAGLLAASQTEQLVEMALGKAGGGAPAGQDVGNPFYG